MTIIVIDRNSRAMTTMLINNRKRHCERSEAIFDQTRDRFAVLVMTVTVVARSIATK